MNLPTMSGSNLLADFQPMQNPSSVEFGEVRNEAGGESPGTPSSGTPLDAAFVRTLPVVAAGEPLHPGGVYLDLNQPELGAFRALPGQVAGDGNRYVAQGGLPTDVWQQLVRACARSKASG